MKATDRLVKGPDGTYGTVDTTCWVDAHRDAKPSVQVQLNDGSRVTISADALIEQNDGNFYIPLSRRDLAALPHHRPEEKDWPCG